MALLIPVVVLAGCVIAVMIMFASVSHGAGLLTVITKLFPSTREEIIRADRQQAAQGFKANPALDHLVGRAGVLQSDARPVGKARFGDEIVDVVTEGQFVARGAEVRAVAVRGGHLLVRQV